MAAIKPWPEIQNTPLSNNLRRFVLLGGLKCPTTRVGSGDQPDHLGDWGADDHARSRDAYAAGHIPGAVSFPHREMSAESTAPLDRSKVYVVYCEELGPEGSDQQYR